MFPFRMYSLCYAYIIHPEIQKSILSTKVVINIFRVLSVCRGDMEGVGERYARDAISDERYKLPKDTTYKQWKVKQDAAHGEGSVDKERKKSYNIGGDEEWMKKRRI